MYKLQILVPQYKETEDVIAPLLNTIALQQGVDIARDVGVIICNDGSNVILSQEFLNAFPMDTQYLRNPHRGISATRNACLEAATADYVMFCDADDVFIDLTGMQRILTKIDEGFNAICSIYLEESKDPETGASVFLRKEKELHFVHGKVFNRHFLNENHLRFSERLAVCEDCHFVPLAVTLSGQEIEQLSQPFYLWRWNGDSITRSTPDYHLKAYVDALTASALITEEWLSRGRLRDAQMSHTSMIYGFYCDLNRLNDNETWNRSYRDKAMACFKPYFERYRYLYEGISPEDHAIVRHKAFEERDLGDEFVETISFEDFLRMVESFQTKEVNTHG